MLHVFLKIFFPYSAGICVKYLVLYCSNFHYVRDITIIYCSGGGFLFVSLSELQLMHIVELISTLDGQIMETLDNIGIKLFVCAV
jgi:hypothetical protein